MRVGTQNGNGAICDICNKQLLPRDVIKIKALQLSDKEVESRTGSYITVGKMDCCFSCYKLVFKNLMSKPRK